MRALLYVRFTRSSTPSQRLRRLLFHIRNLKEAIQLHQNKCIVYVSTLQQAIDSGWVRISSQLKRGQWDNCRQHLNVHRTLNLVVVYLKWQSLRSTCYHTSLMADSLFYIRWLKRSLSFHTTLKHGAPDPYSYPVLQKPSLRLRSLTLALLPASNVEYHHGRRFGQTLHVATLAGYTNEEDYNDK